MLNRLISHRRLPKKLHLHLTRHRYFSSPSLSSNSQTLHFPNSILSQPHDAEFASPTLRQLLSHISHICPGTARRFRRVSMLKPEQAFEILTAFQHGCEGRAIQPGKVKSLLEIFNRAGGFVRFPDAFQAMASLLVRAGLFDEVEIMFSENGCWGILLNSDEIVRNLIEGYVGNGELQRAVFMYERVRGLGKLPSLSCYNELLDHLVRKKDVQSALLVCLGALELGVKLNDAENGTFNNVTRLVCREGKIQDARNVVKKGMALGLEPIGAILNEIVSEYCEKANFEDALGLFHEIRRTPSAEACHEILHLFCKKFGTGESDQVLHELKHLGFIPDEVTYGILIGWNCHYGKLRYAFLYLSDMFSIGLEPNVWSYNALISALFKEGMWKQAHAVFLEMVDQGIKARLSTYKVLLAGFCKARRFEEVKATIREMADRCLIKLNLLEDPLCKAFEVLSFSPLTIRVRRDNHVGLPLAEFYDNLGNGLYLQTDENEYESKIAEVLNYSIILDFNALVMNEMSNGSLRKSLSLANQAFLWGQEVSSSTLTCLIREVRESAYHIKSIIRLLEKIPKLYNQLSHETLNCLLQAYSKKGLTDQGALIFEVMLRRDLSISDMSYSAFLTCLREKTDIKQFRMCWHSARAVRWLPNIKDVEPLVGYLLENKMLEEALELHKSLIVVHFHMRSDIDHMFIQILSESGYTSVAHVLFRRVQDEGQIVDQTAYNYLIEGFIEEKQIFEALRIYDEMLVSNMRPLLTVSVLLIPHLYKYNQFDRVNSLETFCLQRYPSESLVIYKTLIRGLSKTGKTIEAAAILHNMMMDDVSPDSEFFNLLIQNHCQTGHLAKVFEVFGAMIRHNAILEIPSYGKFVNLLCMEGNVLCSLNLRVFMLSERASPILVISNILLFYLFKTCNSSYAENFLSELSDQEIPVDAVTYDYLVQGYCHCGDASKSLTYLMTMISKELEPSPRSLRMVISFLCGEGMLERAFKVIREMEFRGWIISSTVQYKIADMLLCQNRTHAAEIFLDQIAEKRLIGETIDYNSLIKKLCCFGRPNKAVDLVNIMLRRGSIPDLMAYESLIHVFCTSGKLDQALDFHAEMLDYNMRPSNSTWDVLIQNSCKFGKPELAEKLLNAMVQIGEVPTHNMYRSIVKRYRSENNLIKASSLLQEMQQYGYDAEFDMQWSLISNLTNSDLKSGGKADARFLSKLLSDSGFSPSKKPKSSTG
ncbi:hypothetical protein QQ045_018072 [Rhodiola kirilowii]